MFFNRSIIPADALAQVDIERLPQESTRPVASLAQWLVDAARVAIVQCDPDGHILAANDIFRSLQRQLGDDGELIAIPACQRLVERAKTEGSSITRPVTLVISGEKRHFWARFVPVLNGQGATVAVAGALQDWTAERERIYAARAERLRFHDFERASADWFWETDAQLCLVELSDRITMLSGQPAALFKGRPLMRLGRLLADDAGEREIDRAWMAHAPFRNQLFELDSFDGARLLFRLSAIPLFDAEGRFAGFRGAATDVTELMAARRSLEASSTQLDTALRELADREAELNASISEAEAALTVKNEFLANMSHELRTPLNAIIGFAESMTMQVFGPLAPQYTGYAHDIAQAGRHLLGLIEDVLDVSVIENGDVALNLMPVDVTKLAEQARAMVMLRADAKRLDLWSPASDRAIIVRADERRVLQILVNLLSNAVKFTPESGSVGIEVKQTDSGEMVAITIWDTGPGIAETDHERVFDKFQQLGNHVYAGKPEGTGLGLHISRELARLMGGDIYLESTTGQGCRFTVLLPAR